MANYGELKDRIRLETDRDDIAEGGESEAALTTAIARAIEYHSKETFWFNQDSGTCTTTAGLATVLPPYAVRVPKSVAYLGRKLNKVPLDSIQHLTDAGEPREWAANGDTIRLHPIPGGAYTLNVYGSGQLDAPETDADESVWTHEACDLIAARARFLLFRDVFRDVEGTQLAAQAESEALTSLRNETRARGITPLRSTGSEPWARRNDDNLLA